MILETTVKKNMNKNINLLVGFFEWGIGSSHGLRMAGRRVQKFLFQAQFEQRSA
jgi:hypothetical protein